MDGRRDREGVPEGFDRAPLSGGFQEAFGPVWVDRARGVVAFRVAAQHMNVMGSMHGGVFAAFADMQAVVLRERYDDPAAHTPTITVAADCLAPVREGDWLEMTVAATAQTGSMIFTDAVMRVGEAVVGRARAIYKRQRRR